MKVYNQMVEDLRRITGAVVVVQHIE
jgi:hypothetical protein